MYFPATVIMCTHSRGTFEGTTFFFLWEIIAMLFRILNL